MKIVLICSLALCAVSAAQSTAPSPGTIVSGPQQAKPPAAKGPDSDVFDFRLGALCGAGGTTSSVATKPTLGCGVGATIYPLIFVEVGVMGPQANRSYLSGYVSVDGSVPLPHIGKHLRPELMAGYSRLFETGHALDYGVALTLPRPGRKSADTDKFLRIELRDYWTFANPSQHNVMLRLGWIVGGPFWD